MNFNKLVKARIIRTRDPDGYSYELMDREGTVQRTGTFVYDICMDRLMVFCEYQKLRLLEIDNGADVGRVFILINELETRQNEYDPRDKIPTLWCPPVLPTPDHCRDSVSSTLRLPFGPEAMVRLPRT